MSFSIVDGYAEKLASKLDMSLGIESTYVPNLHIASYREQEVRKSVLENKNVIICGTMFDTLCYTGFHAEIIANAPGTQEEKSSVLMREMTTAQLFAYLAIDSYASFDHMFYLPITDPELLVAISSKDDENAPPGEMEALDKTLQDALRRYGNPATVLNGKNNQNVKNAVEVIKSGKNGPDRSEAALVGE